MSTTLDVTCTCGKTYRVPSTAVGRKATCKRCGNRFRVGPPASAARAPRPVLALAPAPAQAPPRRTPSRPRPALRSRRRPGARIPKALGIAAAAFVLVAAGGITLAVTTPWAGDPLDYVPAGMDVVTQINVRRSIDELEATDELERQIDGKAVEEIGIDPLTDIDRVYVAFDGASIESPGDGFLILIEGSFDRDRILGSKAVEEAKFESRSHNGTTYYIADASKTGGLAGGVAWLERGLIAIGSEAMLRRAIDTGNGDHPSIADDDEMGEMIETADREALFWCAVRVPEEAQRFLPEEAQGLESVLIGADQADQIVTLRAAGSFADAPSAKKARKALESAFESFAGPGDVSVDEAIVGKSIEAHGSRLVIEVKVDTRKAEQAAEGAFRTRGGGMSPAEREALERRMELQMKAEFEAESQRRAAGQ